MKKGWILKRKGDGLYLVGIYDNYHTSWHSNKNYARVYRYFLIALYVKIWLNISMVNNQTTIERL